ncbi:ABC transporter permease [Paenibacillus baekrokdamisoli]|uniref:ABC transporter permease n=1 Tax=Paenibacillus baekrokdamisoli TaxID=1712516 RepID=A0A3G9IL06_9BACL|nr:sugar ABC transporter permease [Paenibacillus baekrokdamisoli]MBB3072714.1 ABC-type sugar transport system permease subunit [Paenibacillus baekrokdamisoli]BBH18996.1 ABC transporter permease [Paenibacillus baekrokdamisoli]
MSNRLTDQEDALQPKLIKRGRFINMERRTALGGYLFLLPWLIGLALFVIYPLMYSMYMSFHRVNFTGKGMVLKPIGWDNYTYAFFSDNVFIAAILSTLKSSLFIIPIIVVFAFFVAILLNLKFPGRFFFRGIFFLPVIFGTGQVIMQIFGVASAGRLEMLDRYNIVEFVTENLPMVWAEPVLSVLNSFVLILWYSGVQILIFISGLQTIGVSVYEAAKIDGATPWVTFWKITLPAMTPFILLNLIYTMVDMFTLPLVNPIMDMILGNMSNSQLGYGYASAQGWIYFIFMFAMLLLVLLVTRRLVYYAGKR